MTTSANKASISPEEIARRRKAMSKAVWSSRMAGLGKPTAEESALSELWITGQITHEELKKRRMAEVKEYLLEHGHKHNF
ncbi:MAG: antitoxin VbhA family protein [Litorimonas sp.]